MGVKKLNKKNILNTGGRYPSIYLLDGEFIYCRGQEENSFFLEKRNFTSSDKIDLWDGEADFIGFFLFDETVVAYGEKYWSIYNENKNIFEKHFIPNSYEFSTNLQYQKGSIILFGISDRCIYSLQEKKIITKFQSTGVPILIEDKVLSCSLEGEISYINSEEIVWSRVLSDTDNFPNLGFYTWRSIGVFGNSIVLNVGDYYLLALNYKTGEVLWQRETVDKKAEELLGAKYTLLGHHFKKVPNKNELVTLQGQGIFIRIDIKTGATLEARLDDKSFKELDISADADIAINEKYIYFYQMDGNIGVYEMETGKIVATYDMKKDKAPLVVMSSPRLHNGHFFIMDELGRLHIFEEFKK